MQGRTCNQSCTGVTDCWIEGSLCSRRCVSVKNMYCGNDLINFAVYRVKATVWKAASSIRWRLAKLPVKVKGALPPPPLSPSLSLSSVCHCAIIISLHAMLARSTCTCSYSHFCQIFEWTFQSLKQVRKLKSLRSTLLKIGLYEAIFRHTCMYMFNFGMCRFLAIVLLNFSLMWCLHTSN